MGSLGLIRLRTLPQGVSFADEHGEEGDSRTPNIALINREEISKYQNVCIIIIIIIIDSQHRLIISELKVSLIKTNQPAYRSNHVGYYSHLHR